MGPGRTIHIKRGQTEEFSYPHFLPISHCGEHGENYYGGKLTVKKSAMVLMD